MRIEVFGRVDGQKVIKSRVVKPHLFWHLWGPYAEDVFYATARKPFCMDGKCVWTRLVP